MNNNRRRYLKWQRRAKEAMAKGKSGEKELLLKYKYWQKLYRPAMLWNPDLLG